MKLTEYIPELYKAVESLKQGKKSDAELWLNNFYFRKGRARLNNYVKILQWTLEDTKYQRLHPSIQASIAKMFYFMDTSVNSEANAVFVKRTGNGYVIERKNSS
ncbi:MAG TPA: hypothetical protein VGO98_01305 [Candidatus Saccharimonadales bacterium]|nr:hypothetical protein [Candidatus Saccharimonadales bacterium]